ncbi:twin-arginine translocase TatA/TatE family subunit [Zavarzinia sp. CC-PAN008]|uniref:twin-arginine translocase TatA/TatE family subunit n=1 Tax=Zavarzinia sp. CC-PAN008 TaxID=3243332 RepID=UPI003F744C63
MGSMSLMHWLVVAVLVILLFGRGKLSGLMGDVAQGIKSFRAGMRDEEPTTAPVVVEADRKPQA